MSLGLPFVFKVPGTLRKINIAMENEPFEDVSPIEHGDFVMAMLVYGRVMTFNWQWWRSWTPPSVSSFKGCFFFWVGEIRVKSFGGTSQKSKIDTKNCHVLKGVAFSKPTFLGIHVRFRECNVIKLTPKTTCFWNIHLFWCFRYQLHFTSWQLYW